MTHNESPHAQVPPRALYLSLFALVVPVLGALAFPESLGEYGALLWLVALIPGFLLAYYRGWRGVATALAAGMATLSITQAIASAFALDIPQMLLGVVIAYVAISLGIGWLAEILHRDRHEVEELAFTDVLTGLPNRRHARFFLENEFAAAERGRILSIVLFDLDHFKRYNDTLGHLAGDEALKAFAEVLLRTTRRMNLCARFGGEEFIAVLAGSDAEGASVFADRVRLALKARELGSPILTCSAGVASYHPGMSSAEELLAAADRALYRAKDDGRDRTCVFGSEPGEAGGGGDARPDAEDERRRGGRAPGGPTETLLPHQLSGFGEGRLILLVEDDRQVRDLLAGYLKREGFETVAVGDVPSGVAELDREFDLVVTDLRLPGPSGHEMVSAVKSRWPRTPVLVITGIFDAQIAADALHAGADRYLFKPFGMPDLRAQLVDALARRDREIEEEQRGHDAMDGEARRRAEAARTDVVRGALSLVRAVEVRDPFTRGHSTRVAQVAELLADRLDPGGVLFPRERLRIACELHDVGKIGIPDPVLNKSGPLTGDEFAKVREHTRVGRRILEPMLDDDLVLAVVTWHHEHWDGTGYPDGLGGESIPLAARIVAVADALVAMTHPRAHRDALTWEHAMSEIEEGAGTRFDPAVTEAALSMREELRVLHRSIARDAEAARDGGDGELPVADG